ncbi:MAG TPA: NAD-dependent epimerase/dehydratase family protein [Anaerolineae bacterium]|nr:NAD-dependent epimerase/dehydratase family protein [Anaerolineae bacterium]HQI83984.1 NAD-dependent epimerase/dehydratase family protein [Anaerolineae bacterium]
MTTRALVTGATGCVGANIVEALLARGYAVRALQRAASKLDALAGLAPEYAIGDVMDESSLRAAMVGCELVFHAAAVSQYWRNKPEAIYAANVEGTRNVLRAALAQGVRRVVFTSSVAVLGVPTRRGQLLDESATFNLRPEQFHYGHSKVLAEAEVRRAVAEGLDVVIVNPVSVIGQRDVHFVGGEILRTAKRGLLIGAPPGGMGIVSAKATGEGHVLAAERGRTGERYILNGENISHRALMALAAEATGGRAPWFTIPRVMMTPLAALVDLLNRARRAAPLVDGSQLHLSARDMYFDGSKAARELGFTSGSARVAIAEAWDWYREHNLL